MEKPDAGLRSLDHYKTTLPYWRHLLRQWLIPVVRWETPYLAHLQSSMRFPALDSYFAITANLGTHTCFMVVLPILFWCGYTKLGRGMVHILASGVFFSGFLKDLFCLPRPLSPPLQRITMSGSAALEYGFPSTHSSNAVSVAVYTLFALHSASNTIAPSVRWSLMLLSYFYAASIVLGRLYCGMHGFFDVAVGSALGAVLSIIECLYVDDYDEFILDGDIKALVTVILIILVLVRIHPEPADDCPCFDDSVAFAGVLCGIEFGNWHYAKSSFSWDHPVRATVPYQLEVLGWWRTVTRIFLGVLCIFTWRGIMKPALLKGLPPVFRVVEYLGLSLPRRFFKRASEYDNVPKNLKTDNVMPSVSEIPNFLSYIRHPRRSRSISIGPQSEADAYEALAFRRKRRRESLSSVEKSAQTSRPRSLRSSASLDFGLSKSVSLLGIGPYENQAIPSQRRGKSYGSNLAVSPTQDMSTDHHSDINDCYGIARTPSQDRRQDEKEQREIFSCIVRPRVRYDVEVVTKLIVYAGIAWLAVEGNPILFQSIGLGIIDDV